MGKHDVTVEIGQGEHAKELRVLPQPIPYLDAELGPMFSKLISEGFDRESVVREIYANAYEVLGVLIPDLPKSIRKWEWDGFASQADADAFADGNAEAERDYKRSASIPDIKAALAACWQVNEIDDIVERLKDLGLDPKALGNLLEMGVEQMDKDSSSSADLPSASGVSGSKKPSGTYRTKEKSTV